MKKSLKVVLLAAIMLVMMLALTGCGNKLVATKTSEEQGLDGKTMKYEEKIEISFKKDKVDAVKMTYKFDNEDAAKSMKSLFDLAKAFAGDEMKMDIEQKGKTLTMKLDAKAYAEMAGEEATMTKDEIKASLKEDGYKVK